MKSWWSLHCWCVSVLVRSVASLLCFDVFHFVCVCCKHIDCMHLSNSKPHNKSSHWVLAFGVYASVCITDHDYFTSGEAYLRPEILRSCGWTPHVAVPPDAKHVHGDLS